MRGLILLPLLFGCGTLSAERAEGWHEVLNTVTDVADPLYESAVVGCDATEGVIVARDSTEAEDRADVARVRAACDRVFAAFEALRSAQVAARAAIDAARDDADDATRLQRALEAVQALHAAAASARRTWEATEPILAEISRRERP